MPLIVNFFNYFFRIGLFVGILSSKHLHDSYYHNAQYTFTLGNKYRIIIKSLKCLHDSFWLRLYPLEYYF